MRFFVGQRVRVVSGDRNTTAEALATIGREGRIVRAGPRQGRHSWDWEVDVDLAGETLFADSECLEPITPPHVAGSWEVIEQLLPNIREGVCA